MAVGRGLLWLTRIRATDEMLGLAPVSDELLERARELMDRHGLRRESPSTRAAEYLDLAELNGFDGYSFALMLGADLSALDEAEAKPRKKKVAAKKKVAKQKR